MNSIFCKIDPEAAFTRSVNELRPFTCMFGTVGCISPHEAPLPLAHQLECTIDRQLQVECARGTVGCTKNHLQQPLPIVIHCPDCGKQHVDEGEWATKPHKTHLCSRCKHLFRPMNVPTVGVLRLSG